METLRDRPVLLHLTSLSSGGGYTYTMDFHRKCLEYGYDSYVVIRGKTCLYPDGSSREINNAKPLYWNKLRRFVFRKAIRHSHIDNTYSMYNLCERFTCYSAKDVLKFLPKKPDVIFVHWVSDFANAKVIHDLGKLTGAKIVFLLVDHALYSGGCHYQLDCQGYVNGCKKCPAASSWIVQKGIEWNYLFKKKYLPKNSYVIANKSEEYRLRQSEIYKGFRVERLILPMDELRYHPAENRDELREKWGVPINSKIVLAGATNLNEPRKGMVLLIRALQQMKGEVITLLLAGNGTLQGTPNNAIFLGSLNEQQLIEAYQMADVFVCPTIADAGPMMVQQALMCGTPVVAFPVGLSLDLVKTGKTGYVAEYGNAEDLAIGIETIVSLSKLDWQKMSDCCRENAVRLYSNQEKGHAIDELISKLFCGDCLTKPNIT